MYNPRTGELMETAKVSKVASIIAGGVLLTFSNTLKAVSGTVYNTTVAVETEINRKTRKKRVTKK